MNENDIVKKALEISKPKDQDLRILFDAVSVLRTRAKDTTRSVRERRQARDLRDHLKRVIVRG